MTHPTLELRLNTPEAYTAFFHVGRDNWGDGHWSRFRRGEDAIMGARLWSRLVAPDVYHCIVMPNNGVLENDGTHKGSIFYRSIELVVPAGWQVYHLPRYKPFPEDGPHYIGSRFHFTRRFLICKNVPANAIAILCGKDSGKLTSRGPLDSRYTWPTNERSDERGTLLSRLLSRMPNMAYNGANADGMPRWLTADSPLMGLGNVSDAGEQGGQGIELCPGVDGTVAGGARHAVLGDLTSERNPVACYNSDGSFATRESGLGAGFEYGGDGGSNWIQYVPQFGVRTGESWTYKYWNADNGCPYRLDQERVTRVDAYHLVRSYFDDLSAWMLTGDPACRHRLLLAAEDMRISDTLLELQGVWDKAHSLRRMIDEAKKSPHRGGEIQRGSAWKDLLGATALMLTASPVWRTWCDARAMLAGLIQTAGGAMYLGWPGSDQNEPWASFGLAQNKQEMPSWQTPFLISGLYALMKQLGGQSGLDEVILRMANGLYHNDCSLVQFEDHPVEQYGPLLGLPRYVVTGVDGAPIESINEGVGPARGYYDQHALALVYRLDPRKQWIDRMCQLGKPCATAKAKLADVSAGDPAMNAEAQAVLAAYVARHP